MKNRFIANSFFFFFKSLYSEYSAQRSLACPDVIKTGINMHSLLPTVMFIYNPKFASIPTGIITTNGMK